MNADTWSRVKDVLGEALELPESQRAAFLAERCGDDHMVRLEVETLLGGEHHLNSGFLAESSFAAVAASVVAVEEHSWIGRRVGAYQIVEQIGAGGMGEVYRAFRADDQYRQQVALKVIRAGQDTSFVIRRFKNERQILAGLEHPNIARLLDGGTTEDGLPFFAMELIEGQPITDYCDHHKLSLNERLTLFLQVCAAVQFAHQHLVIHRDIKPGNILVTADGVPKLLDFGIAKLVEPDSPGHSLDQTMTAFRALTPRYGSPEQMQGGQMTTASDVYSLGVVLYELLTGCSPYRRTSGTPQEFITAVCSTDPVRPSLVVSRVHTAENAPAPSREDLSALRGISPDRLRRRLRGDLDNIILKALEKDPKRRYRTVEQLQEDINRHLENLPVSARTATGWYRASRFIFRHTAGVAFSTALAVALLVGLAVTLHEAEVARQQRVRAEQRFNDVRKLANSLLFEIHDSIRDLSGAMPARKLLVSRALEYLDSLSKESAGDLSLQRELAAAYDRVGDLMGYSGAANLGDFNGAMQSYEKALAIREVVAKSNPSDASLQAELLSEYFRVSFALFNRGEYSQALKYLRSGLPIAENLAHSSPAPKNIDSLAGIYWQTGTVQNSMGDFAGAAKSFRQAVLVREPSATEPGANAGLRTHLAGDYIGLATALRGLSDPRAASDASKKGLNILLDLSHSDPENATLREYLAEAYDLSARVLEAGGDTAHALQNYRAGNSIFAELYAADHANALARNNLGFSTLGIARDLLWQHNVSQAISKAHEAVTVFEPADHKNRYDVDGQAESYRVLGLAYETLADQSTSKSSKLRNLNDAKSWFEKSEKTWEHAPFLGAKAPEFRGEAERVRKELAECVSKIEDLTSPRQVR
jgi:non-specific serine/threonine protein kinase/serine/threonine-protein kinase